MARDPFNLASELNINIESLTCPACESPYAKIAEILAPDEVEGATVGAFTGTAGGGTVGAAVGAVGGPPGSVIGGVIGAAVGGGLTLQQQEKARTIVDCEDCGYHGNALNTE